MTHPADWSFPSAFVDNALNEDERTLFEEHLAGCADCRREVDEFRALKIRMAEAPRRSMPPALRSRIARRARPPAWRRWLPAPRWAWAGATAAALAGSIFWVFRPGDKTPSAIDLQPLMIAHAESAAERPLPASSFYNEDAVRWASYDESDPAR